MGLSREGFLGRLRAGKSVNCVYRRDEFAGLISAWAFSCQAVEAMGLDLVELVMTIEDEFDVSIPNDVAPTLVRLGDIHGFVVKFLQERGEAVDPAEVWEKLKVIVQRECAIPEKDIVPEAHLVYDLRLD